jgi:hypothetical protein
MKKIILSIFALAVMGIAAKVQAQCSFNTVVISVNSAVIVPGGLSVNFNITFDIQANGGNKYIYVQSWKSNQWPNYWQCNNGEATLNPKKAPLAADLTTSIVRLGINNDVTAPAQPTLLTAYGFDATTLTPASGVSKIYGVVVNGITYDRFTVTGIQTIVPGISDISELASITSDAFSTQAAGTGPNTPIHCVSCGNVYFLNDPSVTGFKTCATPRMINFGVVVNNMVPKSFTYQIYRDNGDNVYTGADVNVTLTAPNDDIITVTVAGAPGQQGRTVGFTGNNAPGENSKYWVVVTPVGGGNAIAKLITTLGTCAPLPVSISTFTAKRAGSNVNLYWQTTYELNNTGFFIERNVNGTWQEVGFVASQGLNGNSNDLRSYTHVDANNVKGMSQYRLRQVDLDGKTKLSDIRTVRGEDQPVKLTVYPNPSSDGRVNIVFDDAIAVRNVSVLDMSGRVVRTMNGISNNNITIENLQPGMYTVRVVVPETGAQGVEKIIVNKR